RIVTFVVGGVVTNDIDHGYLAFASVVQVGQAVAQTGAEVQQYRRRLVGHARVPVGRTGGDPLEQGGHAGHLRPPVRGCDEVNLGGAGIHEADVDAAADQSPDQGLSSVHAAAISTNLGKIPIEDRVQESSIRPTIGYGGVYGDDEDYNWTAVRRLNGGC